MRRRLFNILAALSLVLCVGLGVLWARSYWYFDFWAWANWREDAEYIYQAARGICSDSGHIGFEYTGLDFPKSKLSAFLARYPWAQGNLRPHGFQHRRYSAGATKWLVRRVDPPFWDRLGFIVRDQDDSAGMAGVGRIPSRRISVFVPFWLPTLLAAAMPGTWLARKWLANRPAARLKRGLCPRCGYDLRATPDRCPECGTAIERRSRPCG